MLTASFTTPSPKSMEFRVGNDFSFRIVKAATVSVAHNTEANNRHSLVDRNGACKNNSLHWIIKRLSVRKEIIVPKNPNRIIYPKLAMKLDFFIL